MHFSFPASISAKCRLGARSRGFTLIELMVVVVIIGILAVIAVPQLALRMRERRASQAAQQIALMYRNARLRAMGRGYAVLVSYSSTTNKFVVSETLPSGGVTNCVARLPPTCLNTNWASTTLTRVVESYNPIAASTTNMVVTVTAQPGNTGVTMLDMCFSPHGRTYSRLAAGSALAPMAGTIDVNVNRGTGSLQRHVTILPNGMARLAL